MAIKEEGDSSIRLVLSKIGYLDRLHFLPLESHVCLSGTIRNIHGLVFYLLPPKIRVRIWSEKSNRKRDQKWSCWGYSIKLRLKDFHLPDFRVGDIIQMKWTHSTSDGKTNTYTGLVLAVRKRNSLEGGFYVMYRFCGMLIKMYVKFYSPFLKDLKILRRGAGNVRNKLAMWNKEDPSPTNALVKKTHKRRYEDGVKLNDGK